MANEKIRVGIIGAGGNTTKLHIPGLQAQDGVEVVAVANRTVASGQRVADEFGIPGVTADWQEIVEDLEIDAVCIGTWPYMHAPMTIAALDEGKHVLCEARMALNSDEAHDMLSASRQSPRCIAQIVPAPHTLAFDQTIIEMISAGYIGDLIALDARIAVGSGFPNPSSPTHWRQDRDLSGNNIMSMGIWYEAMMRWVGPMSNVFATGQAVVSHRNDGAGRRVAMTIPDHVDIIGKMEQGGQIRFNVSTVLGHAPAVVDVCLFGTDGTLRLHQAGGDPLTLYAGKRGEDGLAPVAIDTAKKGAWRVEEEFINAIRGVEAVSHTDFTTAVKYMEWTDAVTLSLRSGQSIALPLMG
ncbi:MAG: Gfo/Idh/MocA family oxidoreductase [Alphaproteobacteria bacterium]|nr:Gfo/Idh/MocA family oxidoreductase [Alphaproteobacteria bacterium]